MDDALATYVGAGERSVRAYSEFAVAHATLQIALFAEVMKFVFSFLPRSAGAQAIRQITRSKFGEHSLIEVEVPQWRRG